MGEFSILTNRRRAIIALVHTVVFLTVAVGQMISATPARGIWSPAAVSRGTWILCAIYMVVSAILLWLFTISAGWRERLYFGMCSTSAASGLLRTVVGDHSFHFGVYVRVLMLASAAVLGMVIVRIHSGTLRGPSSLLADE